MWRRKIKEKEEGRKEERKRRRKEKGRAKKNKILKQNMQIRKTKNKINHNEKTRLIFVFFLPSFVFETETKLRPDLEKSKSAIKIRGLRGEQLIK